MDAIRFMLIFSRLVAVATRRESLSPFGLTSPFDTEGGGDGNGAAKMEGGLESLIPCVT